MRLHVAYGVWQVDSICHLLVGQMLFTLNLVLGVPQARFRRMSTWLFLTQARSSMMVTLPLYWSPYIISGANPSKPSTPTSLVSWPGLPPGSHYGIVSDLAFYMMPLSVLAVLLFMTSKKLIYTQS